jgi:hypothetical protein
MSSCFEPRAEMPLASYLKPISTLPSAGSVKWLTSSPPVVNRDKILNCDLKPSASATIGLSRALHENASGTMKSLGKLTVRRGLLIALNDLLHRRSHTISQQVRPAPHLRTARRAWRFVVLATQTPLTRVLPAPHPAATCVIMPSG